MEETDSDGLEFACSQPGCDESVHYEPQIVSGAMGRRRVQDVDRPFRRIYLRCPAGHVRVYQVRVT